MGSRLSGSNQEYGTGDICKPDRSHMKRKENQIAIDPALEFHVRLIAKAKGISAEAAMREALTRYRDDFEPLAEFLKAAAKKEVKL